MSRATPRHLIDELVWRVRTLPQRLGTLGVAGIVLGLAAAVVWGAYLAPKRVELAQSRHFLEVRKSAVEADLALLPPMRAKTQTAQDLLFSEAEFQTAIERFIELSQKQGLALSQGAYKLDALQDSELRLAVLNFPAQGRYAALRAFLDDAHKLPGVRLQSLQINRVATTEADISVQIQFSMLLRQKP